MARRKVSQKGFGKLLDAWVPPDEAGDPVGVLSTTFTFSAAFFEEECLASFLGLETNPTDDGPAYLIEREDKLARLQCAAVLVDVHHCRGTRSLRWDLLPARLPGGIQHAKVNLLVWANCVRVMIGSANLTEDGYRRNLEVFGVLDYRRDSDSPLECLKETVDFLRRAVLYSQNNSFQADLLEARPEEPNMLQRERANPAASRWLNLLDRVDLRCSDWGASEADRKRSATRVYTLFVEPASGTGNSCFNQLAKIWPAGVGPSFADIVSPFFDPPESPNAPSRGIWNLLRKRGETTVVIMSRVMMMWRIRKRMEIKKYVYTLQSR